MTARDDADAVEPGSPPALGLPVDEIMRRVRREIARHGGEPLPDSALQDQDTGEFLRWRSSAYRLAEKEAYVLSELLDFSDADFISVAYRAILRRSPDEEGYRHFLSDLRSGSTSKVEVLGAIRWSAEGKARGVHVDGLLAPYIVHRWRRKPLIGPVLRWLHALARLSSLPDRLAAAESAQARELQQLGRAFNRSTEEMLRQQAALDRRLRAVEPLVEEVDRRAAMVEPLVERLIAWMDRLQAEERRSADAVRALEPLYAAFEDQFRGERALVRARVEPFLAWMREAGAGTMEAPVIDIGCGRGEWLELLRDHGLVGRGIDLNQIFIGMCRARGLDVDEGEAIASLKAMPTGSVGAVTSMHLVEHLPFERMIEMLDEIHRVLRPGGLILLETPNPENLSVGSCYFYMDPTHRNPLPPQMLRWIVEARGFDNTRIERLTHERDLRAPPLLAQEIPGAASVNVLLASLSTAPDYAIVARRP